MTETPAYILERKDGKFEIRKYPDYILAQVDVVDEYDRALYEGFSILANYIFGGNKKRSNIPMTTPVSEEKIPGTEKIPMAAPVTQETVKSEKIPMTAPVTEERMGEEIYRISFTMPSKYNMESLPEPNDKNISFKEVKNQRVAVLRFSGRAKAKLVQKKMDEMSKWLSDNDLEAKSNYIVAQYNNPAVPGFLRRNEIIVEI